MDRIMKKGSQKEMLKQTAANEAAGLKGQNFQHSEPKGHKKKPLCNRCSPVENNLPQAAFESLIWLENAIIILFCTICLWATKGKNLTQI